MQALQFGYLTDAEFLKKAEQMLNAEVIARSPSIPFYNANHVVHELYARLQRRVDATPDDPVPPQPSDPRQLALPL